MDTLTILDTDVFIDHFRGLAAATAYTDRPVLGCYLFSRGLRLLHVVLLT